MKAGDALPSLERTITLVDMVSYAGATWDWHRLHYDAGFVSDRGLPGPLVDGQMLGALMAKQLTDALGPRSFIRALGFRLRAMVFAGDAVRVEAEVASVEEDGISVAQQVLVGDRLAAEGTARVRV